MKENDKANVISLAVKPELLVARDNAYMGNTYYWTSQTWSSWYGIFQIDTLLEKKMVSFLIASCVDADMRIRHFFLNQLLKLLSDEDCQPENGVGGGG